jgi:cell pole-organizing protein PopZ
MEEILASIRRIISDDDASKPDSSKPPPPTATAEAKHGQNDIGTMLAGFEAARNRGQDPAEHRVTADVIALAEAAQAKAPASDGIDHPEDDEATGSARPRSPREPRTMPMRDRPLLSSRTTAAVDTAFNSLSHAMLMQNPRTLEDLVREMLRPMLKAWLDDNLPNIVERLVRAEIERVSRGGG